jgi:hypothetical protein
MKTTLILLIIGILTIFISCGRSNGKKKNPAVATKNSPSKPVKIDEQKHLDSIRLDKVLKAALELANHQFGKELFNQKYKVSSNGIPISVDMDLGYFFSKTIPHLIVRRTDPNNIYLDVYSKGKHSFEKVLSHEQWTMTYVNDTIRDINGDGLKDFVVNWYGSTGSCLKAFSNVYLLRTDKKGFSKNLEFINPTFSPSEKIIRGVCYGHPGETELYKYKWNNEIVDTLEYISFQKNSKGIKTGKVIITNDLPYSKQCKTLNVLNSVPSEYQQIEGYDWFIGKGLN